MTTRTPVPIPTGWTSSPDIYADFSRVLDPLGLDVADTGGQVTFTGEDPILPSKHRLGAIMAMGMMAPAVGTQILYRMMGGPAQDLSVDLRDAVTQIFPQTYFAPTVAGYPYFKSMFENPLGIAVYPLEGDRWYMPTAIYPKMVTDWLGLLRCELTKSSVEQALSTWDMDELDAEVARRGMIGAPVMTAEQWYSHPQGSYLANVPMIDIIKIGDSDPELPALPQSDRPLSGLKVLSVTHVIAGPITARTLAEQGAQCLDLYGPGFEERPGAILDCRTGLRTSWADLKRAEYRGRALDLLRSADVFIENFRGRKIANFGLSAEEAADRRPGIIYTSLRGFGWDGPWFDRGAFDPDANACTGYMCLEGTPHAPKLPPTVVLNDYLAGYLTAAGVLAALKMRAEHGGSYHVRTSLSRFSMWYSRLGLFDNNYMLDTIKNPDHQANPVRTFEFRGGYGKQVHLQPGITYSKTPSRWEIPGGGPIVAPIGYWEPQWL
ncbi:CoA transferase [Nocardia sp. NPDC002869]|uniref:CoA transferase n=1 Tax=Nocardia sp. NPDC002869 TaxID=3161032 RepID=UPI00398D5ADF